MARYQHGFPTRTGTIEMIEAFGVRAVYGESWKLTQEETIRRITALTDAEWADQSGCDHHAKHGNCLGHTRDREAVG
jgi:hypothetical protein